MPLLCSGTTAQGLQVTKDSSSLGLDILIYTRVLTRVQLTSGCEPGADGGGGGPGGLDPPPLFFDQAFLCKFLVVYIEQIPFILQNVDSGPPPPPQIFFWICPCEPSSNLPMDVGRVGGVHTGGEARLNPGWNSRVNGANV